MDIIRPAGPLDRREALLLLMSRPEAPRDETDQQIEVLVAYAERHGLSLEHCLLAREEGSNVSTCLLVDSPGRTSSVFLPAVCADRRVRAATVCLLREGARLARERGMRLLQGMVAPEAWHEAAVYRKAGFERLTRLIYLENDLADPLPRRPAVPQLTWRTYTKETHAEFARTVQQTYTESLDCGALNGRRDIEDVLASHRGTGPFDPRLWLMGMSGRDPVGVLLLSQVPERWALDVAYMGLLPQWRGRGYGSALLKRGLELAQEQAVMIVTLTVDEGNHPARRLYRRFGFTETSRREAWIQILERV